MQSSRDWDNQDWAVFAALWMSDNVVTTVGVCPDSQIVIVDSSADLASWPEFVFPKGWFRASLDPQPRQPPPTYVFFDREQVQKYVAGRSSRSSGRTM